jgi:hypothetical protein
MRRKVKEMMMNMRKSKKRKAKLMKNITRVLKKKIKKQ